MSDNQQPIALRLAEELETMFMETPIECEEAAILLREQHSEIERLNLQHNAIVNAATAERDALHTELKLVRELMRNAEARAEQAEARLAQASERAIGHVARRKELLAEIDQLRTEMETLSKQEPVAWMMKWEDHPPSFTEDKSDYSAEWQGKVTYPENLMPLYPAAGAQPAPSVPEGWKLVPIEPTDEMLTSIRERHWVTSGCQFCESDYRKAYAAMLAAAPDPN